VIFVDESIQHQLGYICVAFVYCSESPDEMIKRSLTEANLVPGRDEYKSGVRMIGSPNLHKLRESFAEIIRVQCSIGVYIAPTEERPNLLSGVIRAAQGIVVKNGLESPQEVYVDQGILGCVPGNVSSLIIKNGCDSREVFGVQLADYAAYHCSYLLKSEITGNNKKVLVEMPYHPKSQEEVELEWLIRLDLRRKFFMEPRKVDEIFGDDWFFGLEGYGSFFSEQLSLSLRKSAQETFGSMYMGCIF
jgi:hypothetical protein